MASWMDYMNNPREHYLKKTMFQILKERYSQNEQIIERMGSALMVEADLTAFVKMMADVYEIAYMKAVSDHKDQLQKLGLMAKVVPQKSKEG